MKMDGIRHLLKMHCAAFTPSIFPFSFISISIKSGQIFGASSIDFSPEEMIPDIKNPKLSTVYLISRAMMISSSTMSTLSFFKLNVFLLFYKGPLSLVAHE